MPAMMTSFDIQRQPAGLRHAVQRDGQTIALTYRGKPYGYVVPADQWHAMTGNEGNAQQDDPEAA